MKNRLANYFKAGFPCLAIQTAEEGRAVKDLIEAAKICEKGVMTWSATEGARVILPEVMEEADSADPLNAFRIRKENMIYILLDAPGIPWERDPILTRAFRDLLAWGPEAGTNVAVITPRFIPHPTSEKMVTILDYDLPGPEDLRRIAENIARSGGVEWNGDNGGAAVIRALSGLSTSEAENALALAVVETGSLDPAVIYREKVQGVKKSGLLEIIDPDPLGMAGVGGFGAMKRYIKRKTRAFTKAAENYPLDQPKGIMLVGVPGTGKSHIAKAVGTILGLPTLRLDLGNLFASLVGQSEERTRAALALAEAISPCVMWIDEIEKGLAGSSGSGANDSGTSKKVFGTIITWMQERKRPVFMVATANDISALPPEFLRRGRWDRIFCVDLPTVKEREEIFSIHLKKRKREKMATSAELLSATDGFTGAEIESVVSEAMFVAFDEDRDITTEDLLASAKDTIPLSVSAKDQVAAIRAWGKGRAKNVSDEGIDLTPKIRRISK